MARSPSKAAAASTNPTDERRAKLDDLKMRVEEIEYRVRLHKAKAELAAIVAADRDAKAE